MSLSAVAVLPTPRRHARDVLEIIRGLRRQNPRADESQLAEQLADELFEDRALLVTVARDLVHKASAPAKTKKPTLKTAETARRQRVARQEAAKAEAKAVAGKVKETVLLDLLMPNGVAMRYCTGTQMISFGSAYRAIGERVGDAMVGEVIVEHEVRELLRAP